MDFFSDTRPLEKLLKSLETLVSASEKYASKAAVDGRALTARFPVDEAYRAISDDKQLEIYTDYFVLRDFMGESEQYRWIYTQDGSVNTLLKRDGEDWLVKTGDTRIFDDSVFEANIGRIKGTFLEKIGVLLIMNKQKGIFGRMPESNVVDYLNDRVGYPLIETLLKIGMDRLIDSVCNHNLRINMGRRHIWQKLGLSKTNYSLIQRQELPADAVELLQKLDRFDRNIDANALLLFKERLGSESTYQLERLMSKHPMTIKELVFYLENVWQLQGCPWEEAMRLWHDYLTMYAEYYGHMPNRKKDMYPDSLKKEHDVLVKRLNEKKDERDLLCFQEVNEK